MECATKSLDHVGLDDNSETQKSLEIHFWIISSWPTIKSIDLLE
ncbi:24010_t:CDS:2 [Cetraspora pellucida]|uniref:24010_t:CDS:1 n=1 Tax=Cetraspora pellucida TaxID=1433469 RepID=A0A9N9ARH0_9GLOM|nr:24010_t:CDS:2 [Cetraspora pellucida]